MQLNEFRFKSRRTMPFQGNPKNQQEHECMLGNYAMGLIGESVEALQSMHCNLGHKSNMDNLLKELGDVLHYAVGLSTMYKLNLKEAYEFLGIDVYEAAELMLFEAKNISEFAKKNIYHRHEDPFPYKSLEILIGCIAYIAHVFDYTIYEIAQMNIDKLKIRYPETFNAEDSKKRVDTVQQKHYTK